MNERPMLRSLKSGEIWIYLLNLISLGSFLSIFQTEVIVFEAACMKMGLSKYYLAVKPS